MNKLIASLVILALFFVVSGCNTVAGVGKDVQKVGEKVEDAAKKK